MNSAAARVSPGGPKGPERVTPVKKKEPQKTGPVKMKEVRAALRDRGFASPLSPFKVWTVWNLSSLDRPVYEAILKLLDIMRDYKNGEGEYSGGKGLAMRGRDLALLFPETFDLSAEQVDEIVASPRARQAVCSSRVFSIRERTASLLELEDIYQLFIKDNR